MARVWDFTLLCFWGLLYGHSEAFIVPLGLGRGGRIRMPTGTRTRTCCNSYAASTRGRSLRMDDEIARQGIKEVRQSDRVLWLPLCLKMVGPVFWQYLSNLVQSYLY